MCPGAERWLRPRWFTAWTIILPVQLTLPCEEGEREREGAYEVLTLHYREEEIKCE